MPQSDLGSQLVTEADLQKAFADVDLPQGAVVIIHSALSRLGFVVNGARDVIDALRATIGPGGTILAPAHSALTDPEQWQRPPAPREWVDTIRSHMKPFDGVSSPVFRRGKVAELLLHLPGAQRSFHPMASVVAVGADAERLTSTHPFHDAHGPGSPYHRLYEADGWAMLVGVDLTVCTALHVAEIMADCHYIYECPVRVLRVHDDGTRGFERMDKYGGTSRYFERLRGLFRDKRCLRETRLGTCPITLVRLRPAIDAMAHILQTDPDYLQRPD